MHKNVKCKQTFQMEENESQSSKGTTASSHAIKRTQWTSFADGLLLCPLAKKAKLPSTFLSDGCLHPIGFSFELWKLIQVLRSTCDKSCQFPNHIWLNSECINQPSSIGQQYNSSSTNFMLSYYSGSRSSSLFFLFNLLLWLTHQHICFSITTLPPTNLTFWQNIFADNWLEE